MTEHQATPLSLALYSIQQFAIYRDSNGKKRYSQIMRYRDILPNFRIAGGFVEVPADFFEIVSPDPVIRELGERMLNKLMGHATQDTGIFDEMRDGDQTTGRKIPLGIWNRYANMIILNKEGQWVFDTPTQQGFDMAEFKRNKRNVSEFCKHVTITYWPDIRKDETHPCGLATCTRVISEGQA